MLYGSLSIDYSLRHLAKRKAQVALTVGGIALVVFVFVGTLMLAEGLRLTLASTGYPDNVIVLRNGAQNEVQSSVSREDAALITSQPEVAQAANGEAIGSSDILVLVTLHKRSDNETSNIGVRGISRAGESVRPSVRLVRGRMFNRGTRELVVGEAVNRKYAGTDVGQSLHLAGAEWPVVGVFSAGNSAFSSEAWGDVEVIGPAFRRNQFQSVTLRLRDAAGFSGLKARLENERRLSVSVEREQVFYESQSKRLALFIRVIGGLISVVFSLGAIIGAMITMYGAVASRIREIGILRALGFSRRAVFASFVRECLVLGAIGGVCGVLLASTLSFVRFATTNFDTFADLSFGFHLTATIALQGLAFALVMGAFGGALPALRAARQQIVNALRCV